MIHPYTRLSNINDITGGGVVATRLFPAGTVTYVQDPLDVVFNPEDIAGHDPVYQEIMDPCTYRNRHGDHVLCWDLGKYINHSFDFNCNVTTCFSMTGYGTRSFMLNFKRFRL